MSRRTTRLVPILALLLPVTVACSAAPDEETGMAEGAACAGAHCVYLPAVSGGAARIHVVDVGGEDFLNRLRERQLVGPECGPYYGLDFCQAIVPKPDTPELASQPVSWSGSSATVAPSANAPPTLAQGGPTLADCRLAETTTLAFTGVAATMWVATAGCGAGLAATVVGAPATPVCIVPAAGAAAASIAAIASAATAYAVCTFASDPGNAYRVPIGGVGVPTDGTVETADPRASGLYMGAGTASEPIDTVMEVSVAQPNTGSPPTTQRLRCSASTVARLYNYQKHWCAQPHSCAPSDSCPVLRDKTALASLCKQARESVDQCYRWDLMKHADAIANERVAVQNCQRLLQTKNCGSGPQSE